MKASELIELLQKLPPDMPIVMNAEEWNPDVYSDVVNCKVTKCSESGQDVFLISVYSD
jgi:hypothetical protein